MKKFIIILLCAVMVAQAEKKSTEPLNMMGSRIKNLGLAENDGDAMSRQAVASMMDQNSDSGTYNTWIDPGIVENQGERLSSATTKVITNKLGTAWYASFGNSGLSTTNIIEMLWQPLGGNTSIGITNFYSYTVAVTNFRYGIVTNFFYGKMNTNTYGGVCPYSYTSVVPQNSSIFGRFEIKDLDNTYTQGIVRIRHKFLR